MVFCSIAQCGNSSAKCNYTNQGITFHRFPQDPDIKEKWISATGKGNWFPSTNSRICSIHFSEDDFEKSKKRRTLIKTAVPTAWKLFNILADNEESKSSESKLAITSSALTSPSCSCKHQFLQAISTDNQQIRMAAFEPIATETLKEKKLRAEVEQKNRVIKEQRLKIKRLQCKTRRYGKAILGLKEQIKHLEDKRLISDFIFTNMISPQLTITPVIE